MGRVFTPEALPLHRPERSFGGGKSLLILWTGPRFSLPNLTGPSPANGRGLGPGLGNTKKHAPSLAIQLGGAGIR